MADQDELLTVEVRRKAGTTKYSARPESEFSAETIWRYMDFAKFVSFMHKGLWFSRCDQLDDPWEANTEIRPYIPPSQPNAGEVLMGMVSEHETRRILSRHLFVSCWHRSTEESVAMWKIYGMRAGVAIRSTTDRFRRSLKLPELDPDQFRCDPVEYGPGILVDHSQSIPLSIDSYPRHAFFKRPYFKSEQEWRAVLYDERHPGLRDTEEQMGQFIAVEHNELVESVCVDPVAPPYFRPAVQEAILRFGFLWEVQPSEIVTKPPGRS